MAKTTRRLLSVASSLVGGCLFSPLSIHLIPYFQGALVLSSLRGRGSSNEAMTKEETASERTRSLARPTSSQPNEVSILQYQYHSLGAFEKPTFSTHCDLL